MFNKYRHIKYIGLGIILVGIVIFLALNIRFKTVSQHESEKNSLIKEQESFSYVVDKKGNVIIETSSQKESEKQSETSTSTEASTLEPTEATLEYASEGDTASAFTESKEANVSHPVENEATKKEEKITEKATEKPTEAPTEKETQGQIVTCTIEIRCDAAVSRKSTIDNPGIRELIPDDGVILEQISFSGYSGYTVYDCLSRVASMKNISLNVNADKTYVRGIAGLEEKMVGKYSGWTYRVNGEMVMKAASSCKIKEGDTIIWQYVVSD